MDLETAHSIEVITVSTSTSPGTSGKRVIPLQIDFQKFPSTIRVENNKLRRPVRPIDRQRMRPWLMELLDLGNVFGLRWTNRHQGIFQISWRHASRLGWNLETDGDVFERWARHTGIYKEGDPPEPKRWKANFRCALHSLHDVIELTNAVDRRGRNACRTYRFLQSNDEQTIIRKRAKARRVKELLERPYERHTAETAQPLILDSASSEECNSETESDVSQEDKVIVQKLDIKSDIPEEEFCLHHDHDYSAGPDKTQKTIVLRQGVGSIVLHKEILSAPDEGDYVKNLLISNLDQLASAAMSSAGLDAGQQGQEAEDGKDRKPVKHKQKNRDAAYDNEEGSEENFMSECTLKHLLTGSAGADRGEYMIKKRKSSSHNDDLRGGAFDGTQSSVAQLKKGSKRKSTEQVHSSQKPYSNEVANQPTLSPPSSPLSLPRSGSPKILSRRSKKNSGKSEKSVSDSTEPLMSSCLLLLEAATRLDDAEKNGRSPHTFKSEKSKFIAVDTADEEIVETTDFENSSELGCLKEDIEVQGRSCNDVEQTGTVSHKPVYFTSQEILRSTLEGADEITCSSNSKSKPRTIRSMLKDASQVSLINAISVSDGKIVISEAPYAKGLFSGSKIQSNSQPSTVGRKRKKSHKQGKTDYFVDFGASSIDNSEEMAEEVVIAQEAVEEVVTTTEEPSAETTEYCDISTMLETSKLSNVKGNSVAQPLVIQRSLPVLSPSMKTSSSTFPNVVVNHKPTGDCDVSPQMVLTSGASLLQPVVLTQAVGRRTSQEKTSNVPGAPSYISLEKGKPFIALDSNGTTTVIQADLFSVLSQPSIEVTTSPGPAQTPQPAPNTLTTFSAAPKVRTVTLAAPSGAPTSTNLLTTPTAQSQPNPLAASLLAASSILKPLQTFSTLGKVSTTVPSIILGNATKPSTQQQDVVMYQVGQDALKGIQVHIVPHAGSAQNASTHVLKAVSTKPVSQVTFDKIPSNIPGSAVLAKKTLWKVSSTPLSLNVQTQTRPLQKQKVSKSKSPVDQLSISQKVEAIINRELKALSDIGAKKLHVDSRAGFNIAKASKRPGKLANAKQVSKSIINKLQLKLAESAQLTAKSATSTEGSSVSLPSTECCSVSLPSTDDSSVSLLTSHQNSAAGGQSSIVLDFQQALNAHKLNLNTLDQADLAHLSGDECQKVKPLAELCKRYLAQLFTSLDNQTSESDDNDSAVGSPKTETKDETLQMETHASENEFSSSLEDESSKSDISAIEFDDSPVEKDSVLTTLQYTLKSLKEELVDLKETASINTDTQASLEAGKESQARFIDPTAPLSIGEIPLFACGKGDSDSLSSTSD